VRAVFDFVDALPSCDVDHHGPVLDAGTDAMRGRFGWSSTTPQGVTAVEHDGSTWSRVVDRKLTLSFLLTEKSPIFVAARAEGYAAKNAQVVLDDAALGSLSLAREQIKIVKTDTTTLPVDPGLHQITIRFAGRARDGDAFADLDWIHVGLPEDAASLATYGAPTLRDLVVPAAALGGVPHRSIALRAPGVVRCVVRAPAKGTFRVALGVQGGGEGEAEIAVRRDGEKIETLTTTRVEGGDKQTWQNIEAKLEPYAGQIVALELRARASPKGGRVLFGDPQIVIASEPPPVPKARVAIVVVLDGVERAELPP